MSLYSKYLEETEDIQIIETDYAYITYRMFSKSLECFIVDLFVLPKYRRTGIGKDLVNQVSRIALNSGYKYLTSTIIPSSKVATNSMKFQISIGMQIIKAETDKVWLIKGLK